MPSVTHPVELDPDLRKLLAVIQDAFDIRFPREKLSNQSTVADLYNAIAAEVGPKSTDHCLTSHVFYRLRKGFIALGAPKAEIRPYVSVVPLLRPRVSVLKQWTRLSEVSGLKLPRLDLPIYLVWLIFGVSFMPLTVALAAHLNWIVVTLAVPAAFALIMGLQRVCDGLRSQFPNHALLMSDLTRATLALNYEAVSKSVGAGTRTDVWRALSFLLAEYTGADPWAVEQHWPLANIVEEGLR